MSPVVTWSLAMPIDVNLAPIAARTMATTANTIFRFMMGVRVFEAHYNTICPMAKDHFDVAT
jgi:hypothetical protein